MEVKIYIPKILFQDILILNTKRTISEYIIKLIEADLKKQNIKDDQQETRRIFFDGPSTGLEQCLEKFSDTYRANI